MPDKLPAFKNAKACITFLQTMRNDLQTPAIKAEPIIAKVLDAVAQTAGCQLARMSGSGGTCFGLYLDEAVAQRAAQKMQENHPEWWVVATNLS
jgi:4-diphosphocytidyl-2-C-methyl-D-erythritol kinase